MDDILEYALKTEAKMDKSQLSNYDSVKSSIVNKLSNLRDAPKRRENALIYHLDVAAMYPNIILTNRLQPPAVVNDEICASCDFNKPENQCKRKMNWTWRGDYLPTTRSEYELIKSQLESERFPDPRNKDRKIGFYELLPLTQAKLLKDR
jgi:DNA polymerase epsilon subunit 1